MQNLVHHVTGNDDSVLNYDTARNSSASVIYIAIAGMSESTI